MNRPNSTYCLSTLTATTSCALFCFTFTGKEKDYESGYHYFGARYYDCEALTGWLSVDPMIDKYPGISPYAYCAWNRPTGGHEHRLIKSNIVNNPVRLVDPDGRDVEISKDDENKTVTIRTNFYYNSKNIGKDADVFIKGFQAALESWQEDIKTALGDGSLGVMGYKVNFEFNYTDCDAPDDMAKNDPSGNWISNSDNVSGEASVRGCKNLQVDFSRNLYSSIDGNPLFYGNEEYQGTLKHEIGHLFGLYDRYASTDGKNATPMPHDLMSIDIPRNNAVAPFKRVWLSAGLDKPGSKTVTINKKNREVKQ